MYTVKIIISFLLIPTLYLHGQQIVISGVDGNRDLQWSDFTGVVDKTSSYSANTHWNITYRYSGVRFENDKAALQGLIFKLELDRDKSWIKHESESAFLLKHEQGHFDIARLCLLEMKQSFDTAAFYKADYKTKPQTLFNAILAKYNALSETYDAETNHSKKQDIQKQWDLRLSRLLASAAGQ